jgi:hypothetical protein
MSKIRGKENSDECDLQHEKSIAKIGCGEASRHATGGVYYDIEVPVHLFLRLISKIVSDSSCLPSLTSAGGLELVFYQGIRAWSGAAALPPETHQEKRRPLGGNLETHFHRRFTMNK